MQDGIGRALGERRGRRGALHLASHEATAVFTGDLLTDLRVEENNRAKDLIENLRALEDPAFDTRPLSERVKTFNELNRNYGQLRDAMARERGSLSNSLRPLLTEAVRPLVLGGAEWVAGQPGIAGGRYSGPIISLTRMPDLPKLRPEERRDFETRREIVNRERETRRALLRKQRERLD